MLLIFPGQIKKWASFYHQMHQLIKSGFLLPQALDKVAQNSPSLELKGMMTGLSRSLKAGRSLEMSLKPMIGFFPPMDLALLIAGEHSGKMDHCLLILSTYYHKDAQARAKLFSQLTYPMFLLSSAFLINPVSDITLLMDGHFLQFLAKKIVPLGILGGSCFGLLWMSHPNQSVSNKELLDSWLHPIPLIGTMRTNASLGRFCLALEALTSAGITPDSSWLLAAKASGSARLEKAVRAMNAGLKQGQPPSDLIARSHFFPPDFTGPYSTGEAAGSIDESLKTMAQHFTELADEKMQTIVAWLPRIIFILVSIALGAHMVNSMKDSMKAVDQI